MKQFATILGVCITAVIYIAGCAKDKAVSGIQITNGNCTGKIFNPDGSSADGAVVRLIPLDYDPYSPAADAVDSTHTDASGGYAFMVSRPQYYNIVAEKGSASCMRSSVFIQSEARTLVDNDTLRESGKLSGNVSLKQTDDARQALILVLGTNVYTAPSDSSGGFVSPPLPSGTYTVRIFTTQPGYAVFDTVVVIGVGAVTRISVSLPSSDAPSVEGVSAAFDSAKMFATIRWRMPDTSKMVSYSLFRRGGHTGDTVVMIDKSATSFTDDVIELDGDTLVYQIACIGKSYRQGYRASAAPIIACGIVHCVESLDLTDIAAGLPPLGDVSTFVDRNGFMYLNGTNVILKLDQSGRVVKDYLLTYSDPLAPSSFSGGMQSDLSGYLYILKFIYPQRSAVVKFDSDLNELSETEIDSSYENYLMTRSIEALGDGSVFTFSIIYDGPDHDTISSEAKRYDRTGALSASIRFPYRQISGAPRFGDTIVTYDCPRCFSDCFSDVHFYDTAFRQLTAFGVSDIGFAGYCTPRFCGQYENKSVTALPGGIFVVSLTSQDYGKMDASSLLLFMDGKGAFLARAIVPYSRNVVFDDSGNLYLVACQYPPPYDGPDNPLKTLYKYTMASLLKKEAK